MKRILSSVALIVALLMLPSFVQAATIRVEAFIDGNSLLIIRSNSAHWHHLDFTAPGIPDNPAENYPTIINHVNWLPLWDLPTTDCDCNSSAFLGVAPALPLVTQNVTLTPVQVRMGGSATIIQQPSTANDYTLIVQFNDPPGGAAWYIVQLEFAAAQPIPTMTGWGMIFFVMLAGLVSISYLRRQKKAEK
jgi:hypothetical protein